MSDEEVNREKTGVEKTGRQGKQRERRARQRAYRRRCVVANIMPRPLREIYEVGAGSANRTLE